MIDFRALPGGNVYYAVFEDRVHKLLLKKFATSPQAFLKAGLALKAEKVDLGDIGLRIPLLPHVNVTIILYQANEEFPADCKFLFEENIGNYLSTEEVMRACEGLVEKLIQKMNESKDKNKIKNQGLTP